MHNACCTNTVKQKFLETECSHLLKVSWYEDEDVVEEIYWRLLCVHLWQTC